MGTLIYIFATYIAGGLLYGLLYAFGIGACHGFKSLVGVLGTYATRPV
jgi:hypothetical protein